MWDDELAKYANIRAKEIITNFSHVRNDGTKCYVLSNLIYGENISRGPHTTGAEFLEHWINQKDTKKYPMSTVHHNRHRNHMHRAGRYRRPAV